MTIDKILFRSGNAMLLLNGVIDRPDWCCSSPCLDWQNEIGLLNIFHEISRFLRRKESPILRLTLDQSAIHGLQQAKAHLLVKIGEMELEAKQKEIIKTANQVKEVKRKLNEKVKIINKKIAKKTGCTQGKKQVN